MSFAWTTQALLDGKKDMTRRLWSDKYAKRFKRDDLVVAYDRQPRFGGKQVAIIKLTKDLYKQKLKDMPEGDVIREGNLWKDKKEFIELFGGDENLEPWVIEFVKIST